MIQQRGRLQRARAEAAGAAGRFDPAARVAKLNVFAPGPAGSPARSFGRDTKIASLIYAKDLLRELVARDLKIRYEGTFLGFAWTLARPLLTLGVLFFVFQVVLMVDVPRFTSFALTGILVYTWFQSSLVDACNVALSNRDLVRRPQFKTAVLPLVPIMTGLIHFLLALPVLAMFLLFGGSGLSAALITVPLVIMIQFILTAGLAYFAAATTVLYRDTGHLLSAALMLFFFVSPIFYDVDKVPPDLQAIYRLNPLVALLEGYRNPLLHGVPPDWGSLATVAAIGLLLAFAGYTLFEKVSHRFAEEL